MGTSNLYRGPKGSSLLPEDYTDSADELIAGGDVSPEVEEPEEEGEETTQQDDEQEQDEQQKQTAKPEVSWTSAKKYYTTQLGSRRPNVRRISEHYTKAAGGYKRAASTSKASRQVASGIINLLSGTPDAIRQRLEEIGIVFAGRTTKEIFNDICNYLRTGSSTREEAVADKSLAQAISDFYASDLFEEQGMNIFNPDTLRFLVTHYIANSIYYRLLNEISYGELTADKNTDQITRIEQDLKGYIDGLVNGKVPEHIRSGMNQNEISHLVKDLYERCYKVMEGLAQ